jgi:hypothetical protein
VATPPEIISQPFALQFNTLSIIGRSILGSQALQVSRSVSFFGRSKPPLQVNTQASRWRLHRQPLVHAKARKKGWCGADPGERDEMGRHRFLLQSAWAQPRGPAAAYCDLRQRRPISSSRQRQPK